MGVWDFVKRHKKKLGAAAILVGAGCYAYKTFKQKKQQLDALLGELEASPLMAELEKALGGGGDDAKKGHFQKVQQVSDEQVLKLLPQVRQALLAKFPIAEIKQKLEKREGDVAQLFLDFQVAHVALTLSSIYVVHLFLLFHRVVSTLVATKSEDKEAPDLFVFFSVTRSLLQQDGLDALSQRVQQAVEAQWAQKSLKSNSAATSDEFLALLRAVHADLWGPEPPAELLLAVLGLEHITLCREDGQPVQEDQWSPRTRQLVDELRDVLDSPQFRQVVGTRLACAVDRAALQVLAQGASAKLAQLCRPLKLHSEQCFAPEPNAEVNATAGAPEVAELGELLFFG